MLIEWVRYLATRCQPEYRRLGYLYESIAIEGRYRRCEAAWQPHLEQCRQSIMEAADACEQKRTALIFGSGGLHDIPLQELSEQFGAVWLADVLHLPRVRKQAAALANVHCIESDVTGVVASVAALNSVQAELPHSAPCTFLDETKIDLVVSANLLSQLPVLPERWLRRLGYNEEALHAFGTELMQAHLDYLRQFHAVRLLLTDLEWRIMDGETCMEREDPLRGLTLPSPDAAWLWSVAPKGERDRHFSYVYQVGASRI